MRARLARVAPKLGPGEQVLFEGHPSWRAILAFYIKGLAITAAVCLLVALGTSCSATRPTPASSVLAIVGVGLTILAGFIKRVATSYTITNRRLHIKRGIVSRTIQETRLERVQNVNYQPVVQRMLQVGDVDFDTAAGDDYNFVFAGVAEPERRRPQGRRGDPSLANGGGALGDESAAASRAPSRPRRGRQLGADAGRLAQRVGPVGALPGEVRVLAAEVAVGGGLLVDRPVQVELLAERAGAEVEVLVRRARRSGPWRSSRCRTSRP